jgi:oxepin-CoA hydrolase/3-oxo-5,6-dehydrosuberyl-CoA semialdehyde dehydrogenase
LIVKEKIVQEQKVETDAPRGIVKWQVEVYDDEQDMVAIATILTMVKIGEK